MSTQPVAPQSRLLTVAEYLDIGEVEPGYTELAEGRLLMSPSGVWRHARALLKLWQALETQLPPHLATTTEIDVDLQLAPAEAPGTVRRPDVVVVHRDAVERIDPAGGVLRASDVVLAIEVLSPGSRRLDRVLKRAEYADAGIPHYWIIDLDEPVSLVACHLAGEFGYVDGVSGAPGSPALDAPECRDEGQRLTPLPVAGVVRTSEPFPVEIDLDALL
jgi:Uma2 family endonuclease